MVVHCIGCKEPFDALRPNRVHCKPHCGRTSGSVNGARKRESEAHVTQFIGVDGEGVTRYERQEVWDDQLKDLVIKKVPTHDYVLLSVGNQNLHRDGERLTWQDIFPFLWDQYLANPDAAFVGFFLGYDFSNWFRDIRAERARMLLTKQGIALRTPRYGKNPYPFPVRVAGWEFDILGDKRFKLRPYVKHPPTRQVHHKDGTVTEEKNPRPWMYVCDAGPFFQTSLLAAIDPTTWEKPIVTDEEFALIQAGKVRRSDAKLDDEMIAYNVLENEILARLMTTVNEGLVTDDIRLTKRQWFGPGQAAQAWLNNVAAPPGEVIREVVPDYARDAARASYYGGWFEIFFHGPIPGTSYGYDINSAYPFIINQLPCLLHGSWRRGAGRLPAYRPGVLRMVNAKVRGRDKHVGAMQHRRNDGTIYRPKYTAGWFWWHELQAAKRAKVVSIIETAEWIEYTPCECEPPLASISELYEGRLKVGKNSSSGKAKKLIYNSAYGKLAQSVGQPKFTNAIWASLITAGCRTMILDAIASHPTRTEGLLMVATDSVVFKDRHPSIDLDGTRLGAWDETVHENLSLLMPGMYWDDYARERIREGKSPKLKSRGLPAKDLAEFIHEVDKQWSAQIPKVNVRIAFGMITAKQAITRNDWPTCAQIILNGYRTLSADAIAKRLPLESTAIRDERYGNALRSFPYEAADPLRSTPYDKSFGEEMELEREDLLITPDGSIDDVIKRGLLR